MAAATSGFLLAVMWSDLSVKTACIVVGSAIAFFDGAGTCAAIEHYFEDKRKK